MIVLGIESSCDETSAALVSDDKQILSHIILSQTSLHKKFGGVVPEIAARSHLDHIESIINECFSKAKLNLDDIDAIAVTSGPGLIGGVIVGVMTAKAIACITKKPIIAVNHLEGHALTVRLTSDIEFPYLLLLVSGGHCQILIVYGPGKYKLLGSTIDDAVGEAFDKVGKMLGLPYPAGPIIEKCALTGDHSRFVFPEPLKNQNNCNFSFSGLKTSVKRAIDSLDLNEKNISDICASFQKTVANVLNNRLEIAFQKYIDINGNNNRSIAIAGGVAANKYLISNITNIANKYNFNLFSPTIGLCTDNAAMIAWAGIERYKLGLTNNLNFIPRANWPLEDLERN
jgi:N6-L-threonylcarbamoyladenine synthase